MLTIFKGLYRKAKHKASILVHTANLQLAVCTSIDDFILYAFTPFTLPDATEFVYFYDCDSIMISDIQSRDLRIVCGDFNALLHREGHGVKNCCGNHAANINHLDQFIVANSFIPINVYLR